jgi:hypothetical protein
LNKEEFLTELSRLKAVTPKSWDDQDSERKKALTEELWIIYQNYSFERWSRVVGWVVRNHKANTIPTVYEFTQGREATKDTEYHPSAPMETSYERYTWMIAEAAYLSPKVARWCLGQIKKYSSKFHPDVEGMLLQIISGDNAVDGTSAAESPVTSSSPATTGEEDTITFF